MPLHIPNGRGAAYVAERALRRAALVGLPFWTLLFLASVLKWLPLKIDGLFGTGSVVALAVAIYALFFWLEARRFRAAAFRVCLDCSYPLKGLADAGGCPECGAAFDIAAVRREWGVGGTAPVPRDDPDGAEPRREPGES